ncbi:MAG: tetratricopeptide repeat protein [Chitinophagaceae bacterium]|nr:tetratricopeptide repeat protein [Chitinophagaceae bacterium]
MEEGSSRWVTLNEEGKSLELYSSLAYLNLKKYPEAIEEGNKALKLNPNSAMVYNNLGAIYASLFKYDTAAQYYTKALVIKPKFAEPIKNLAGCYYNLKKYSDCITTLQKLDIATDKDSVYLSTLLRDAKLLEAQAAKK